jgi:hydrogenase maturation protease
MDGGTLGLGLLPHISGFERLLVIDAIDAGDAPGTLIRLEGRALADMPGRASVHQLGFSDLMVAMKLLGDLPGEVVVFGVQPMSTEWSAELTPAVEKAIGPLLDSVIEQLEAWQEVTIT